jgi:hypothetical protein
MTAPAGTRRLREMILSRRTHLCSFKERQVERFRPLISHDKSAPEIHIGLVVPQGGEGHLKDIPIAQLLHPILFSAKDPFEWRGQGWIEVDARRYLAIDREVEVPERIFFADRCVRSR